MSQESQCVVSQGGFNPGQISCHYNSVQALHTHNTASSTLSSNFPLHCFVIRHAGTSISSGCNAITRRRMHAREEERETENNYKVCGIDRKVIDLLSPQKDARMKQASVCMHVKFNSTVNKAPQENVSVAALLSSKDNRRACQMRNMSYFQA